MPSFFFTQTLLASLISAAAFPHALRAKQPNIVLLIADDLGYAEVGCQGNTDVPTPHIDSIANTGVRFTSGYVTASYCSASRAGLMTGKYQARFGYDFNPIGAKNEDPNAGLPVGEKTIGNLLQAQGYATALIGKWHLGGTAAYHPLRRGFDEFFGFAHEGHYYVPPPYRTVVTMLRRRVLPDGATRRWTSADGRLTLTDHMGHNEPAYDADNPIVRGSQPVEEQSYLTQAFTREAIGFIKRHRQRPFCLCLAYNAVHSPLQAALKDFDRFAHISDIHRRVFAGMLAGLDESVGEVLKTIQDAGLEEDTIVVFLSDNGGPTKELTSSNRPFRAGKGATYEGGLRVPFLMKYPSVIGAGRVEHRPVISIDLLPTLLALAGGRPAKPDGRDLIELLQNETRSERPLYWRMGEKRALRFGRWKLVKPGSDAEWELYDLQADISESKNLAVDQSAVATPLIADWEDWNSKMSPPIRW